MMRRTLTLFKDRFDAADTARIYSFAFGDSETDSGSQVMAGQLEFCSAVALHKMHAAAGFGLPAAFNLTKTIDVTDGRNIRNPARPIEILTGPALQSLSRRSAKTHTPQDVEEITKLIGDLTDSVMLPLFDKLRPFAAHTQAMKELIEALNDSNSKADPVQSKVRALLFDGSGNRNVFDEHVERLKERSKELHDTGQPVPSHLTAQLTYCDAVNRAIQSREDEVKLRRAYLLFNIGPVGFAGREKTVVDGDLRKLRMRARAIFDTTSTQAFQIGYLMAVLTKVEILLPPAASYQQRIQTTKFVSNLFLAGMNSFFSVPQTKHRTLAGYVLEGRASAFESAEPGFRGLLAATNVRELNEKQWEFFRYMVFEVTHSKMASAAVLGVLKLPENVALASAYRAKLSIVLQDVETLRDRYFDAACRTAANTPEFRRQIDLLEMKARAEGKSDDQVKLLVEEEVAAKKATVLETCRAHLRASLGRLDSRALILKRLMPPESGDVEEPDATVEEDIQVEGEPGESENLEVAMVADELLSSDSSPEVEEPSNAPTEQPQGDQ